MSRYIDADALIADLDKGLWGKDYDKALAEAIIQDAPSIEIIRCRECKYCVDAGAQKALVCDNSYIDMDIHPDDFCSYGERKDDEG